MVSWDLGSAATQVFSILDNIPTAISGAQLLNLIDKQRLYIERFTGDSIGSTAIAEKYQMALVYLSCGCVQDIVEAQGADAESISLGEFSIKKGTGSSGSAGAKWTTLAERELQELKPKYGYYKSW